MEDIAFGSGVLLSADALFQLDGGSGYDTLSADFSNQPAIVRDSATPTNVDFADGSYFHNFEVLRYFRTGSGNDSITQRGRVDNQFFLGAGDDFVNAGIGVDTIDGGAGNDFAVIDFSVGDTAEVSGVSGYGNADGGGYYRSLVANSSIYPDNIYLTHFERVQITGTSKADVIVGTYGDDMLIGGAGNDRLDGNVGGNNFLDGGDGDDVLLGSYGANGTGADDTINPGSASTTFMAARATTR